MKEVLDRIEKEACNFEDNHPYDSLHSAYYMGARSERNKVVGEMLKKLDDGYKDYVWYKHLRLEIESLKLNQRKPTLNRRNPIN